MKKALIVVIAVIISISVKAQNSEFGAGISYGMKISKIGLNLKYNYGITESIYISAKANFFMPEKTEENGVKTCSALTTLNLDGSYRLGLFDNFYAYPFVGLNYTRVGTIIDGKAQDAESYFGANLGFGAKYNNYYLETKYVVGKAGQIVLTLGYEIDW